MTTKSIDNLANKYNISVINIAKDHNVSMAVNTLLDDIGFIEEMVRRMKLDNKFFKLSVFPDCIFGKKFFWIVKDKFIRILSGDIYCSNDNIRDELSRLLKICVFCDIAMYIGGASTVDDANRFMKLLKDDDFKEILSEFELTPSEVAREDCFYYDDAVWGIVGEFFMNR